MSRIIIILIVTLLFSCNGKKQISECSKAEKVYLKMHLDQFANQHISSSFKHFKPSNITSSIQDECIVLANDSYFSRVKITFYNDIAGLLKSTIDGEVKLIRTPSTLK